MAACILDDKSFEICMLDHFMWGLMEPSAAQNLGRWQTHFTVTRNHIKRPFE